MYLSYRQTIGAYPTGGGSYTVARRNLGVFPGLLAAAALLLDYVLVVAVGISAGLPAPRLVQLLSPYRHVLNPIIDYVFQTRDQNPDRQIVVLIPELVTYRWYQHLLHNKRAGMLKALLLLRGDQNIVVIIVPWYLSG